MSQSNFSSPHPLRERHRVDRPIFFIGMPRSGTTILFEAFARHRALAWPSKYTHLWPRSPWLNVTRVLGVEGRKAQYAQTSFGNRYLPTPNEAYGFWNALAHPDFGRGYLSDVVPGEATRKRVTSAIARLTRWQRRARFSAKVTGPPRIRFLSAIFPDAIFVHVVRDGRAVVHSLMRVEFWRTKGGMTAPFWSGGPPMAALPAWEQSDRDPGVLAAMQWNHVLGQTREEASSLPAGQYIETRYEDFIAQPVAEVQRLLKGCGLEESAAVERYILDGVSLPNMNEKFRKDFSPEYIARLSQAMQPSLDRYGYEP